MKAAMEHLNTETLTDYAEGILSVTLKAEADLHLQNCDACKKELLDLQSYFGSVSSLASSESIKAPDNFLAKVRERIEESAIAREPKLSVPLQTPANPSSDTLWEKISDFIRTPFRFIPPQIAFLTLIGVIATTTYFYRSGTLGSTKPYEETGTVLSNSAPAAMESAPAMEGVVTKEKAAVVKKSTSDDRPKSFEDKVSDEPANKLKDQTANEARGITSTARLEGYGGLSKREASSSDGKPMQAKDAKDPEDEIAEKNGAKAELDEIAAAAPQASAGKSEPMAKGSGMVGSSTSRSPASSAALILESAAAPTSAAAAPAAITPPKPSAPPQLKSAKASRGSTSISNSPAEEKKSRSDLAEAQSQSQSQSEPQTKIQSQTWSLHLSSGKKLEDLKPGLSAMDIILVDQKDDKLKSEWILEGPAKMLGDLVTYLNRYGKVTPPDSPKASPAPTTFRIHLSID